MCKIKYLSFTLKKFVASFLLARRKRQVKKSFYWSVARTSASCFENKEEGEKREEKIKNKRGRRYCQLTACTTEV